MKRSDKRDHHRATFLSSEVLEYKVHFQSIGTHFSRSITAAYWMWCIKHLNEEITLHWIADRSCEPLSLQKWDRICTSKWWYCHVISLITELCTLTRSKWKVASSKTHHVLCRYMSGCVYESWPMWQELLGLLNTVETWFLVDWLNRRAQSFITCCCLKTLITQPLETLILLTV